MWRDLLTSPALYTAAAMAVACATLSVFVVSRRWAFIGEGISHSGFGGAGTAWLLALALPGSVFEQEWVPYCGVVVFSLVTAAAIGYLTRGRRIDSDTAIGIFMVASLAWGFIAQAAYLAARHRNPAGWSTYLLGQLHDLSPMFAEASVLVCAAVVVIVALLRKEILFYCFDPAMAEAAGVRAAFIHYLLMLLVALTIIIGARVVGPLLMTALLVLPGAAALAVTQTLSATVVGSLGVGLTGTLAGLVVSRRWPFLPEGPAIVLALFVAFVLCYGWSRVRRG
jgi:manganese/iron transport system permease protein